MYGNTKKIARAMGEAVPKNVKVIHAGEASPSELELIDLLIVGSPIQGFRATKTVHTFIERIHESSLKGMKVAAFDTRMPEGDVGKGLRFIMRTGGYAAPRIAKAFKKKGGNVVVLPEGFFVKDKEDLLKEGELERAASWAKRLWKGFNQ